MFEQIDGILACPDLICARCDGFRSPWYLYMGSKTALCSSTWALCADQGVLIHV